MQLDLQYIDTLIETDWVAKIVMILIVVIVCALAASFVSHLLRRIMKGSSSLPSSSIFINICRIVIWMIGLSIILDAGFNINVSALITALGVGGIAISLGFQDTISNLIGGLQVSIMKIIQPGDHVKIGTDAGVVKDVTWRHTSIVNASGEVVIIPNSVINKSALVKLNPINQVSLCFLVRFAEGDLEHVARDIERRCIEAAEGITTLTQDPKAIFTEITDAGMRGKVVFRVLEASKVKAVSDAALRALAFYAQKEEAVVCGDVDGTSTA